MPPRIARYAPYILLTIILLVVFAALIVRGLNLGFVGDVLEYEYHYERLGTLGGMRWLVTEHLQRHILAPLFSAPLAFLFPGQSAAWYGYAMFVHFANGVVSFLLADTLLRGQRRWLAFAIALLFVFHDLQIVSHFEYPTGGHRKSALFIALLGLVFYVRYVRGRRQNHWLREFALAAYMFAVASYEQTALFFLLHPILAYIEDRRNGAITSFPMWVWQILKDSFWYPVFLVGYLLTLTILFPPDRGHMNLSLSWIGRQIGGSLGAELSPLEIMARAVPAFEGGWLLLTGLVGAAVFALLWLWKDTPPPQPFSHKGKWEQEFSNQCVELAVIGLGIIFVSIIGVAPGQWYLPDHPRLIYPSALGFALFVTGVFGWLAEHVPNRAIGRALFAAVVALFVGVGVTQTFQVRDHYQAMDDARQAALAAIKTAIPKFADDAKPYLLIYSDADPTRDLALSAQDNRFPLLFNRMYDMDGFAADALYFSLDDSLKPADDVPGNKYNGQFMIVEPEGIYSPLLPYVPLDPDRLVIVYYDNQTQTARMVDELPADVVTQANIVMRAPLKFVTNRALIAPSE